jgi:peptidoglycan/xylan/chitin deacetylase (PgdA/CDA1 family)
MYHEVNEKFVRPGICISPKNFAWHMDFLYQHNYNVLSIEQVAKILKNKLPVPSRSICITFDDGFAGVYKYAFSVFKKYNFPAAIFVTIDKVDTHKPGEEGLTWDQIKEMSDSGLITIGSHTLTHRGLASVNLPLLRKELRESKEILESKLGKEINFFAYPLGSYNDLVQEEVKNAGYKAAFVMKTLEKFKKGIYTIPRVEPLNTDNRLIFFLKISGYYKWIRYNPYFYRVLRKYFNLQDFW